jgi:ribosomal protein S18 acetylase RimI-like enzyme
MSAFSGDVSARKLAQTQVAAYRPGLEALLRVALSASKSGQAFDVEREVTMTLDMAERHPHYVTVVAGSGERVVGVVVASIEPDTDSAFILWIATTPDVQRQGIGNRLIDHLQDSTRVSRVTGYVNLDDPVAVGFWTARGWRRVHPPPQRVLMGRGL